MGDLVLSGMNDVPPTKGRYPLPCLEGTRVSISSRGVVLGRGVFTRCWLGIEEVWDVVLDDGATIHLYPCFGDTMEPEA